MAQGEKKRKGKEKKGETTFFPSFNRPAFFSLKEGKRSRGGEF